MTDYGDEIIVKKVVSDNPDAPKLRAEITVDGQKYRAGLWVWTRKDGSEVRDKLGNLQYKGKVEVDDYKPSEAQPKAEPEFVDSDIPF